MNSFYCPYCSPKYQFQKTRSDGVLICGLCGDPLLKKPLIKPTQSIALIAVLAFIAPLIMMVATFINDQRKPSQSQSGAPIAFLTRLLSINFSTSKVEANLSKYK